MDELNDSTTADSLKAFNRMLPPKRSIFAYELDRILKDAPKEVLEEAWSIVFDRRIRDYRSQGLNLDTIV